MQTRPKVRPKIRIGHNVAIIYPFYQGKCDKYLQGAFPLFVPYCCAVTLTVAMQLSPQPSVAFTRSSAASYRCSEASASLHLARQKIKLFYSLKTPCAWRNPLFGGEVRQCAWLQTSCGPLITFSDSSSNYIQDAALRNEVMSGTMFRFGLAH